MSRDDHRVYSHLCEPLRVMGFTLDEVAIFVIGMTLVVMLDSVMLKFFFFCAMGVGLVLVKRLKKLAQGFHWKTFLHWHFGVRFGADSGWPASCYRRWLP
jgi:hypothetical protein